MIQGRARDGEYDEGVSSARSSIGWTPVCREATGARRSVAREPRRGMDAAAGVVEDEGAAPGMAGMKEI